MKKLQIFNRLMGKATDKIEQGAENLVGSIIDKGAERAANIIGESFSKPIPNPVQIPEQDKQHYMNQMLGEQSHPIQQNHVSQPSYLVSQPGLQQTQIPFYQEPLPPFPNNWPYSQQEPYQQGSAQMNPYPVYQPMGYQPYPFHPQQQVQLTFDTPVLKLEADRVEKMAKYETWFFFKVMKVAKDTIRFVGMKYFSWKIDDDIAVIQEYEQNYAPELEKAYKKAKYNLQKLEEIKSIQGDKGGEDEEIFKSFVYDAILDNLAKKNELGQLKIPSIWEIGLREVGFFAYEVFSPNKSIEMFFDSIQSDFGKAILNKDATSQTAQ